MYAPRVTRPPPPPAEAHSDAGVGLLLVFVAATLVMVGAVIAAAAVNRWWVLVPVMCVDLAATFGVFEIIARLLRDDGESP